MANEVATTSNQPNTMGDQSLVEVNANKELAVSGAVAASFQEIQAAVIMARRFPRNPDDTWGRIMKVCQRPTLAEKAEYRYPRGGSQISGPSVYLARAIASEWGNLRWGMNVLRDDEDSRVIRGWCWDVQTNSYVEFEDSFEKLIFRKKGGWVKPDERDLRELTNRRGAILIRNAIYNVVPRWVIDDALQVAHKTLRDGIQDPDAAKKNLILKFERVGVTVPMIVAYLGHEKWNADDIVELTGVYNSIKEGSTKIADHFDEPVPPSTGSLSESDVTAGDASTHQSYGDDPEKMTKQELVDRIEQEYAEFHKSDDLSSSVFLSSQKATAVITDDDDWSKNTKEQLKNLLTNLRQRRAKG